MAGQAAINDQGFNAAVVINKYQAVVLDTSTAQQVTTTATANANHFIGIAQEDVDPVNYDPMVNVRMDGISFAIAAGAINIGDTIVTAATAGQVESVQGNSVATPNVIGKALTAAANAGDLFLMRINSGNY